jgi:hypothetical protein
MTQTSILQIQQQITALLVGANQQLRDPYPAWNKLRDQTSALRLGSTVVRSMYEGVRKVVGDDDLPCSEATNRTSHYCLQLRDRLGKTDQELLDEVMHNHFRQIVRLDRPRSPLS